jgi:hypothetical protein
MYVEDVLMIWNIYFLKIYNDDWIMFRCGEHFTKYKEILYLNLNMLVRIALQQWVYIWSIYAGTIFIHLFRFLFEKHVNP